jgi:hypothetical protein
VKTKGQIKFLQKHSCSLRSTTRLQRSKADPSLPLLACIRAAGKLSLAASQGTKNAAPHQLRTPVALGIRRMYRSTGLQTPPRPLECLVRSPRPSQAPRHLGNGSGGGGPPSRKWTCSKSAGCRGGGGILPHRRSQS